MYPVLRTPRGSLMRKCDRDQQSLAVGRVYHFYVDETMATNGDGTESSPWNNINNALTSDMRQRCQQACTKVYVHVSGSIDHYIGGTVLYDFMDNLICMPWNQERVTVDPGANCLYLNYIQRAVYASGIIFRQFDFTQTVQPGYDTYSSQIICLPRCTLENCTVGLYASSSGLPETMEYISICAIDYYGNVINSTINIFMTDSSDSVRLSCRACDLTTAIDSTFTVNISGGYSVYVDSVVNMYGPTGAYPYMARCNVTVNINSSSITGFLVRCGENTVIEYSNISGTIDGWGSVMGVTGQWQMYSSEVSLSLSSPISAASVVGVRGGGDLLLVGCSITAQAEGSGLTGIGSIDNHARGIEYGASFGTTTLLVDSCTINASATHSVTWPEPGIEANSRLYETSCALWAQDSYTVVSVIDSELSSGACVYQHYDWRTGIVTNGTECTSETYYPASCLLGA